ncbi:larval cuticle protein LCP-17-like [Rhynchophorus ferrugineus]|uniref:larval cuticle protein LCP-17-like n=1 Tax=Rhynchophorus ferrugineus TaxID=354439 RepID=UPI003FCC40FE
MFRLVVLSVFVAFVSADVSHLLRGNRPQVPGKFIAILRSDSDISPDGSYHYSYETENGIAAQERGSLKSLPEGAGTAAQGSYQYISPEGVPVSVQYVADENGFQPQSDILPTPPPIPSYILRALEYNAQHPEPAPDAPAFGKAPAYRRY